MVQIIFYQNFILTSSIYFSTLSEHSSKILAMKMADLILLWQNQNLDQQEEMNIRFISEKEISGLQHLGGYVMHKLYKKLTNSKNYKQNWKKYRTTTKLQINKCFKSRWSIANDMQKIFIVAEKFSCTQKWRSC